MANNLYRLHDVLPFLVQHNMKHIDQFKDPTLGKPIFINNSQDMRDHIVKTLFHPGTKSFTGANNRDVFYNRSTNTMVIINASKDKNGNMLGGTAFRPIRKEVYFNELYREESWNLGRNVTLNKQNGILALHPDIAREHLDQQKQAAQNNKVAEKTANLQNQQQKSQDQDKAVSAHKTPEAAAHQGQEKTPDSQQQKAAQQKNIHQPSETKKTETVELAAGKSEAANQAKQQELGRSEALQRIYNRQSQNQSERTASNQPAAEQKAVPDNQPNQQATSGNKDQTAVKDQSNHQNQQINQQKTDAAVSKESTPQPTQSEQTAPKQAAAEQKAVPDNQPNQQTTSVENKDQTAVKDQSKQPDQQATQQKTDAAVSKENTQQPTQSERTAPNQPAAEQKAVPDNQSNQQATSGNKDQTAVKDQSNHQNQQINQQKTDAAVSKENTPQPTQSERTASNQAAAEQKAVPDNQPNQQAAAVGNKDQSTAKEQPAQQAQSAKAEEGKAEKQDQSGQSQALQNMYQRQEQQAQAMEAPQQQSSAPETG